MRSAVVTEAGDILARHNVGALIPQRRNNSAYSPTVAHTGEAEN